jgi:hypothetical protein
MENLILACAFALVGSALGIGVTVLAARMISGGPLDR